MDSITHIALGACIGEAFFNRQGFGKKAIVWGAIAQSIPDIDVVSVWWLNTPESLLAHRGFTHSILFAFLIIPIFAIVAGKIHRKRHIPFKKWLLFFGVELFVHLFIDAFNNYGAGWLEPFSHVRYSFNAIYVVDPLFSLWPGIAFLMLLVLNTGNHRRRFWWKFGVIIPFIYLGYCTFNKIKIDNDVQEIFISQQIPHERYFTTPAPLQNWLWFVVSGNDSGYYVGYRSVFDRKKRIDFEYFPRNGGLLKPIAGEKSVQKLIRFSQQFYTVEQYNDTLVFNDLRFGQIIGWQNPGGRFVFHYYLQYPEENTLVVQRGRFAKWDWKVIKTLLRRIKGN